jgi:hypothetical protein
MRLRELQHRFAAALFEGVCAPLSPLVRTNGIDSGARLSIYVRQLHAVFARTLALEFPVIERLVGDAFFRRLAREFQAAHPSGSGNLHHIGAPFPSFLAQRFGGGPYEYFADVAQLEWVLQECLVAPESAALDLQQLMRIDPAAYANLHFTMHPACRLLCSGYPTLAIWRANQPHCAPGGTIDLASGEARVLARRDAGTVELHALSAPQFALLSSLAQDFSLGTALESAQRSDPAFDLGPALRRYVALQVLTTVRAEPGGGSRFSADPARVCAML